MAVRKSIWLPLDLARDVEKQARLHGTSVSVVIQEALRRARTVRLKAELADIQRFWSDKVREKGIVTERQLERHLRR